MQIMEKFKGKKIEFKEFTFFDHIGRPVFNPGFRSGWLMDYEIKPGYDVVRLIFFCGSYFVKPENIQLFKGWMD